MISGTPRITVRDREVGRDVVSRDVPRSGRYRSRNKKLYMYQTCRTDCDAREKREAVGRAFGLCVRCRCTGFSSGCDSRRGARAVDRPGSALAEPRSVVPARWSMPRPVDPCSGPRLAVAGQLGSCPRSCGQPSVLPAPQAISEPTKRSQQPASALRTAPCATGRDPRDGYMYTAWARLERARARKCAWYCRIRFLFSFGPPKLNFRVVPWHG